MRELKADFNPVHIAATASPLLVGKLPVSEVAKFDFPRLKLPDAEGYDDLTDEQLTERMIDMAKVSISRKRADAAGRDLIKDLQASAENDEDEKARQV